MGTLRVPLAGTEPFWPLMVPCVNTRQQSEKARLWLRGSTHHATCQTCWYAAVHASEQT